MVYFLNGAFFVLLFANVLNSIDGDGTWRSLTTSSTINSDGKDHTANAFKAFTLAKKEAVSLLRRHKRSMSEECREGCDSEETRETFGNRERGNEYMTRYKCQHRWFCPHGCHNTNYDFSHINRLNVACKDAPTTPYVLNCNTLPRPLHCNKVDCSSETNYWCVKCKDEDLLYRLVRQQCKEMCSWENRWCWPGTCSSSDNDLNKLTSNCRCQRGFTQIHNNLKTTCQPIIQPSIESCLTRAIAADGTQALTNMGSSKCSEQTDMYGRFQVRQFIMDLNCQFVVNTDSTLFRPSFVSRELFGITDADVLLEKVTVKGVRNTVSLTSLKQDSLSLNPVSNYATKPQLSVIDDLKNGESFCLTFHVKGGGYLVSINLETEDHNTTTVPYTKTENSRQLCYIYDNEPPVFCPDGVSCQAEPLKLSKTITTSRGLKVSFRGWSDPYPRLGTATLASGIESYEISVYEMTDATNESLMRDRAFVAGPYNCSKDETEVEIQLPEKNPMLYAVLMEVKDRANNVKQTRRFVLYDNTSNIVKNDLIPLRVVSASNHTKFVWQIHHKSICYTWENRFFNNNYKKNNPLRPIKAEANNAIKGIYDQITGVLSVTGTKNVNGLTNFFILFCATKELYFLEKCKILRHNHYVSILV